MIFPRKVCKIKAFFYLDIKWVEENCISREPKFNKRLFQRNNKDQSGSKHPTFPVPIKKVKETGEMEYCPKDPPVENYS